MLSFFLLQNPRHGLTESVPLLLQISSGPHAPVQQAGRRRRAPAEVRPRDGHAVRPQPLLGRPHATLRPGRPRSGKKESRTGKERPQTVRVGPNSIEKKNADEKPHEKHEEIMHNPAYLLFSLDLFVRNFMRIFVRILFPIELGPRYLYKGWGRQEDTVDLINGPHCN